VENEEFTDLEGTAGFDRSGLLKRIAAGGAALSIPALLEAQKAMAAPARPAGGGGGNYPKHPKWRFVFVNHVTTNPFFVPTIYGAADACSLIKCSYQWTGSETSDVGQMLAAFNAAVAARAAGIAVAVTDPHAFEKSIASAKKKGIPVVAYNADGAVSGPKQRMAYIGQSLFTSGQNLGNKIVELVPKGDVVIFIATPGTANIQPRADGALDVIKKSGKPINVKVQGTDPITAKELPLVDAYYLANKSKLKGMFAVDAGDTQAVGQTIDKHGVNGKVKGAGFDLLPITLQMVKKNALQATIDQQPYLQGFYPVMQLFLFKLSGGLMFPSDTNTSLLFVTKDNVKLYLTTKTRYEGSSPKQKYPIS
jgi:simple sugar transport system substrate-binding protein